MVKYQTDINNLGNLIENSSLLYIFGDDKEGIQTLAGFLREAAERNFGNPEDVLKWQKIGKPILKKLAA